MAVLRRVLISRVELTLGRLRLNHWGFRLTSLDGSRNELDQLANATETSEEVILVETCQELAQES